MEKKKTSIWKKIWLGAMYLLAVFWALTIIVMLIPSGENTRNAYKSDFQKPEVVDVDSTDEMNCLSWVEEYVWSQISVKEVRAEKWATALYISWIFKKNSSSWDAVDTEFMCSKDLSGDEWLWKKHGWMFVLSINWNIVAQDME